MMLEKSYFEQFLALEKLCQTHRRREERDKLVIAMFIQAVRLDNEPIALIIVIKFESVMLRSTGEVVPAILTRLRRNTFLNEMKLYMLQRLQPSFYFRHADELVEILEEQRRKALKMGGFVLGNTNPMMIMVVLTQILNEFKAQFRSLILRIDFINDDIQNDLVEVL